MEIFKLFSLASEYLFSLPYITVDNRGKKERKKKRRERKEKFRSIQYKYRTST